jgi:DNA-binding transcriptional LysR family regulator
VLHVSQPTRTAQIKKLEDALRLRLLGGRRRTERNLLPMSERVLQDLNTVQLDVQEVVAGMPRRGCGSPRCRVAPSTAYQPSSAERTFVSA